MAEENFKSELDEIADLNRQLKLCSYVTRFGRLALNTVNTTRDYTSQLKLLIKQTETLLDDLQDLEKKGG